VSVLLFVPLIFAVSLRFAVPLIERSLPIAGGYRPHVVSLFCMLAGVFPALMLSFIMLDEKDEDLFPAFRVLPISPLRFLLARLVLVATLGFVYALIIMAGSRLVLYSLPAMLSLSSLCALLAPAATLVIVSVAGNKIEGLTVSKGLFPAILLPLAGVVAPAWWTSAFAVLPTYWIYRAFAAPDSAALARASMGALAIQAAITALFYRRFRRRVFP
jgi:fluoroquinolone transport system permease protein